MELGFEVYNKKAECGVCHTLKSADSDGNIGPNLDLLKPTKAQVISAVTNGIGVMQAWEGILTEEEIEDLPEASDSAQPEEDEGPE